ncbi:alpha-glucosidase [Nitratireductor aquibiodomus]|uniref:Alpha-glucosidase n=1 Tax=Nitratireductor aquibiodomus TaxID=204799 RepID=A0A1H4JG03_9HYPH|nr:alpha-amylase family glycosyl hydrolase [Nitratireductor aquibiodomus]SEB45171.1 alpha-glucosidase [Nitratireductor aquibiodomus]
MNVLHDVPFEHAPGAISRHAEDTDWWRGAVIYQIYPRSFQDSNGDGLGDLKGITQRLPYIASLGVDAIWISPFFKSPMLDFGYDVSDYREVDPMFGSLADFDAMITEAHRLGLKVMIDQVISHSSDQHPWFMESRQSRINPRADWYVWADPKQDGSPPNNWLSIFGGSAWQWDTSRCQYYLHNFLASQPDLNFHNPDVQDALLDSVRFWLERGVDGFRLDTINFYVHSAGLEDNPPLEQDERNASIAPAVNPYNYQDHLYDKNQPENLEFLKRFRALLDEFPGTTAVGEVGDAQRGLDIVAEYTSDGDKVHMCYSFDFLSQEPLTPKRVRDVLEAFEKKAPDGWSCWSFSNHDVVRHASRWADQVHDREAFLKMTTTLLLSLRGSVCFYQGEELGLTEAVLDFKDLQDPYGIQFWPTFKGRDGCRTPMVWSETQVNAGFSAAKPWLPVPPEHLHLAVSSQDGPNSLLAHYRRALAFRARHPVFAKGDIAFRDAGEDVIVFERSMAAHSILVAINMAGHPVELAFDAGAYATMQDAESSGAAENGILNLPAYGYWFGSRGVGQ